MAKATDTVPAAEAGKQSVLAQPPAAGAGSNAPKVQRAGLGLQEPELCSPQASNHPMAVASTASVGGRVHSTRRDEISGGEQKLLQLNAH